MSGQKKLYCKVVTEITVVKKLQMNNARANVRLNTSNIADG